MKKFMLLLSMLMVLLLPLTVVGADRDSSWQQLNQISVPVIANVSGNVVKSLMVEEMSPLRGSAPEVARAFLDTAAPLLGVDSKADDLRLKDVLKTEAGQTMVFQQQFEGIRVFDGEIKVHISPERTVSHLYSNYQPHQPQKALRSSFRLSETEAVQLASAEVNNLRNSLRMDPIVEKVFVSVEESLVPAFEIKLAVDIPAPADWLVVVSAIDGSILLVEDRMLEQSRDNKASGRGSVFPTCALKSKVKTVNLVALDGSGHLRGDWIQIRNEKAEEAHSSANKHIYELDSTHFNEVMVYYHITLCHDYFKSKFNFSGLDKQMLAVVNYGDNYDNAFFSPWQGMFAFGNGNKLNDLSRDAGVVYHEYVHAVTGAMASLHNAEAGAMNESFSDYFAAVLTNDPDLGAWVMAKLGQPYLRSMVNDKKYPDDIQNQVHRDSQIYSGALWDLRKSIPDADCDKLVHFSRTYLGYRATFADGLAGMLSADRDLFNGKYRNQIVKAFSGRGIHLKTNVEEPNRFEFLNKQAAVH